MAAAAHQHDVIVIGGGHNGLTAAGLLAGRGRKVLLLERSAVLGGLAAGDEFHPGFTSVGPLHETSALRPAVVGRLDLAREGLEWTAEPPAVLAPQPAGEGPGLLLHHDPDRAVGEIEAHSSADARHYGDYRAFLGRIGPVLTGLLDAEPPSINGSPASQGALLARGVALRRLGRRDMMELLRIGPMCVADWLGEWFQAQPLRCALALPAVAGTRTGPWSPGTAANLLRHEVMAGRAVVGGPAALVGALQAAARRRGVDIRLGAEVTAIRTRAGAVAGVTLRDGQTIDAPVVAASCDPKQVFLRLLGPTDVTPKLGVHMDRLRCGGAAAKVDLALRGPLRFACRPDLHVEHARIAPTIDDMERAFDAVKYGRFSESPVLEVSVPSISCPDLAPGGQHVVSVTAHAAPYDLRPAWTDSARESFGDAVVETLERYAPGLRDLIAARRVLTPVDIERRYGVTGGHVHHAEHGLDQMLVRPAPLCARYATPVAGLYLCGSGSHPGGGLTCGPGALGAAAILKR